MEFRYVPIFAMALVLAVGATRHVALPAEMYWTSVFPNTPMTKALQNLLIPPAAAGNHMKAALANMIKRYKGILIPRYVTAYRIYENVAGNSKQEFGDGNMATNKDVFFFESKLRPSTKMNLKVLTSKASKTAFLPRPVADSIPFSTKKFAQVLKYFSVQPKSAESKILKKIIEDCETPTIEGEEKFCATSLESFVDFGVSKLGKDIQLLSAELEKETQNPEFSIGDQGVKLMGKLEIVCHKIDYAYAVFLCHSIAKTDVYRVPLVGADWTTATILAICHQDTSAWSLAFAGKHGTLPEEDHWISVFPNTPMPKALKDILPPPAGDSSKESKGKDAPINPFIIYENTNRKRQPKGVNAPINPFIIYGKKSTEASRKELKNKDGTNKKSKGVNAPINPFIIYGKESKGSSKELKTKDHINKKSKGVNAPITPFTIYGEKSKGNKKHGSAAINGTMFFFQEDLHPGKRVNLPLLAKTRDLTTFLPQQVARSIPFSYNEFPQILNLFSLDPESVEANDMEQTINVCEREGLRGEEIFCATSFESFVDSSVSKLGKNIQLLANELAKETNNPVFTIGRGIQNMGEEELVCHKMSYPYAVFLCHSIDSTVVYKVPLVGMDGTKAKALVICHKDTSAWSPNHPVFEILKVKPGTVPICHFAVRDTLAWVRK